MKFKVGDSAEFTTTVTAEKNKQFAELSGDFNPVHFDATIMAKTHFKKPITNGIFVTSSIGSAIVKLFVTDKTIVIAIEQHNSFLKPVYIDDTITARITVDELLNDKGDLWVQAIVKNQNDQVVMSARFRLRVIEI